jgi:hypothetical protein
MAVAALPLARAADPAGPVEKLREAYRADADKYVFHHDAEKKHALKLVEKPVMRWATDDDWSGDVFVWTHEGRPDIIGCILSGPGSGGARSVFHEFHLLGNKPIAPADLQTRRRWQPSEGLPLEKVAGAPVPAKNAAGRLTQMRQISREFTAHMQADGEWELRLLPQPLFRYGSEEGEVQDGALLAYVWTKGTDPEVVLLLESRQTDSGRAWHYAPVRFSTRELWLRYHEKEIWRVATHREPNANATDRVYTTAYAKVLPPRADADPKEEPE